MDHDRSDTQVLAAAAEIRRYIQHHPGAADTVDGISRWWLTQRSSQWARETVQQALDMLAIEGVLQKTYTADGNTVYSGVQRDDDPKH